MIHLLIHTVHELSPQLLINLISYTLYRYIEEHVQRTSVAIETQGFTLITSGKKRESLTVSQS